MITTYDENGGYPHPDHIMCHQISVAAFDAAADPDVHPELGPPWQPLKLYYSFTFHRDRMVALDQAMTDRGLDVALRRAAAATGRPIPSTRPGSPPGSSARSTSRPRPGVAGPRDPGGPGGRRGSTIPLDVHEAVWPTEDWELVRSHVEVSLPEDDLFAGIAVPAESRVSA